MLFMRKVPQFAKLNGHEDHNEIAFIAAERLVNYDIPHLSRMN